MNKNRSRRSNKITGRETVFLLHEDIIICFLSAAVGHVREFIDKNKPSSRAGLSVTVYEQ